MAITAGTLSQTSVASTSAVLTATAATGGTAPYTYQWYQSTASGFTPGAGNLVAGATSLTQTFSGLIPNTQYYYKLIATDATTATATYAQLAVVTAVPTLSQNQFAQSPFLGVVDLPYNYNTKSVLMDLTQPASPLVYAGCAVKLVPNNNGGVPKVIACTADTDQVFGFINFDIKTRNYAPGAPAQISQSGNVIWLYATGPIAQGSNVTLDVTSQGGVTQAVTSSGNSIVGYAYDGAAVGGTLIRVELRGYPNPAA
jgi:hypothetical protein